AVVPQPRRGVIGIALAFILRADGAAELVLFLRRPALALGLDNVAADLAQHHGGLLAAHHGDARVRPHPQEARRVGAAGHAVIAGAIGAADHDGELWHSGGCHRRHQLRAVARDAAGLVVLADYEDGDRL